MMQQHTPIHTANAAYAVHAIHLYTYTKINASHLYFTDTGSRERFCQDEIVMLLTAYTAQNVNSTFCHAMPKGQR